MNVRGESTSSSGTYCRNGMQSCTWHKDEILRYKDIVQKETHFCCVQFKINSAEDLFSLPLPLGLGFRVRVNPPIPP